MVLWPLDGWILLPVVGLVEGSGSKVSAKQWATFQLHTETTGSVPRFNSHACYENECEKRMQSSLH